MRSFFTTFQIDFFETSLMKELERRQTKQHFVDKIDRQFLVRLLIEIGFAICNEYVLF